MQESLGNILINPWNKDYLLNYFNSNPEQFNEAVRIALSGEQPQAWRAAWLLGHCMETNDKRIKNHIKSFIEVVKNNKKDGYQREFLRILEKMDIDEDLEGYLFDACMDIWETINKIPSVRIYAFRILIKIAAKYPELLNELDFISQEHYIETLSPGIKTSFTRMYGEFKKTSHAQAGMLPD
jgi:hypothetical protein